MNYMQLIQIVLLVLIYYKYRWLVTKWYIPSSSPQFVCFHLSALLKIADGPLSKPVSVVHTFQPFIFICLLRHIFFATR